MKHEKSWKIFELPPASFGLLGIQTSRNAHDLSIPNGIDQVAQHLEAWQVAWVTISSHRKMVKNAGWSLGSLQW